MEYFYSSLIGYFLGSFPSAYFLLKKVKNIDITAQGSGNVGAMNTFDITKSKILAAIVLLIDALKGLLCVYFCLLLFPENFIYPALALLFAVFSHCYNPWLRLKGGRGLATSAGGTALLFPVILIIWCIVWLIIYVMKKDIILANVWATGSTIIILFSIADISLKYSFPQAESLSSLLLFSTGLMIIILTRHIEPFIEFLDNKKKLIKDKDEKKAI
jgi:glycerol-3-phosphate acyltransferase PlsY